MTKEAPAVKERPGLAVNTLWTWASVAANLAMGVFVTRLVIRKLGHEPYGLSAIVFSVVEYYAFLDLGMRAAVVKYVAEHRALGQDRELVRTLNAAFLYYLGLGTCVLAVTLLLAAHSPELFVMSAEYRETFASMVLVAGIGWAISAMFSWFAASLEAIQRFDVSYRVTIMTNVARVVLMVTLLELGFGLLPVVSVAVGSQLLQCALLWRPFRRHFPQFRWAFWDVDAVTFRKMFRFGIHVVPSTVGSLLLGQGPGIAIGHVFQAQSAGYYAAPRRLIQGFLDLVHRLGSVTTSRAAELAAHGNRSALVVLGIQSNRYSLTVFMPAAVFLIVYGDALLAVWLEPSFAAMSAPLLPAFVMAAVLADASQFSSGAMLYGMGRHQTFAWLLMIEGVVSTTAVYYFASHQNLLGAAITSSAIMIFNRGFVTPTLICRELDYPLLKYITAIAARPFAVGLAVAAATLTLRLTLVPGSGLGGIAVAGLVCSGVYVLLAGRYCIFPDHHDRLVALVGARAPILEPFLHFWFGTRRSAAG